MEVNRINNYKSKPYITPRNTGYAATVSMGIAIASGVSKNKTFRKMHKPFAYLSAIFVALHIAILELMHRKYKKM